MAQEQTLAGKTAYVAGASSGINLGIAKRFKAAGATVVIISRSEEKIAAAAKEVQPHICVQGNLDPLALIAGGSDLTSAVENILSAFTDRPHVFNLGHGILPDTPIEHVQKLLTLVRKG